MNYTGKYLSLPEDADAYVLQVKVKEEPKENDGDESEYFQFNRVSPLENSDIQNNNIQRDTELIAENDIKAEVDPVLTQHENTHYQDIGNPNQPYNNVEDVNLLVKLKNEWVDAEMEIIDVQWNVPQSNARKRKTNETDWLVFESPEPWDIHKKGPYSLRKRRKKAVSLGRPSCYDQVGKSHQAPEDNALSSIWSDDSDADPDYHPMSEDDLNENPAQRKIDNKCRAKRKTKVLRSGISCSKRATLNPGSGLSFEVEKRTSERVYYNNKRHACLYCQVTIGKISRHLITMHRKEPEVHKILMMRKRSSERRQTLMNLLLMGDFSYNCKVLAAQQGKVVLVRCPTENIGEIASYYDFMPCPVCVGFFLKRRLLPHVQNCCALKNESKNDSSVLLKSKALINKVIKPNVPQTFIENVLSKLKRDDIGLVAVNDHLITDLGQLFFEEIQKESDEECREGSYEQCRKSMLLIARLLVELRIKTDTDNSTLDDFIHPNHFDSLTKAVTDLCSFTTEMSSEAEKQKEVLAISTLRNHVKMGALILRGNALRSGNVIGDQNLINFFNMCNLEWSTCKTSPTNLNLDDCEVLSHSAEIKENTERDPSTKQHRVQHTCPYCHRKVFKLKAHLRAIHKNKTTVAKILNAHSELAATAKDIPKKTVSLVRPSCYDHAGKSHQAPEDIAITGIWSDVDPDYHPVSQDDLNENPSRSKIEKKCRAKRKTKDLRNGISCAKRTTSNPGSGLSFEVGKRTSETALVYYNNKRHACLYCQVTIGKISRHLITMHRKEPEVHKILMMRKRSCERRKALVNLLRVGDFSYNCKVLAAQQGKIVLVRCPTENIGEIASYYDFMPCPVCAGFFLKRRLLPHVQKCYALKNESENDSSVLLNSKALINKVIKPNVPQTFVENIKKKLKRDEIGVVAVNDHLITELGQLFLEEIQEESDEECREGSFEQCRQSMLLIARLLVELRIKTKRDNSTLDDFIHPNHFDSLTKAVTDLCSFTTEMSSEAEKQKEVLAISTLRSHVKMGALILRGNALRSGNVSGDQDLINFSNMCNLEWSKCKTSPSNLNLDDCEVLSHSAEIKENNYQETEDEEEEYSSDEEEIDKIAMDLSIKKHRVQHTCLYCHRKVFKLHAHLRAIHKNKPVVAKILSMPISSKERRKEFVISCTKKTKLNTNINNNVGSTISETDLVYYNSNKHVCFYCQVKVVKISCHLMLRHTNEPEISSTIKMHKRSCERRKAFLNLIRMGDFSYNCKVLAKHLGKLVLARCPEQNIGKTTNYYDFTPCPVCLGFYMKKRLLAHVKKCCALKNETKIEAYVFLNSKALMNKVVKPKVHQTYRENVLSKLKQDEIGVVAVNDHLIRDLGLLILEEIQGESDEECKEESYEQCRQSMLLVAQLLINLRAKTNKNHSKLKEFNKPCHFDSVTKAVTDLCSFTTEMSSEAEKQKEVLAISTLRNHVKMGALILRGNALRSGNIKGEDYARHFFNICSLEWSEVEKSDNGNKNDSVIASQTTEFEENADREIEDKEGEYSTGKEEIDKVEMDPSTKKHKVQHTCFYCHRKVFKMHAHLRAIHKNKPAVARVLCMPIGSKERRKEFITLCNKKTIFNTNININAIGSTSSQTDLVYYNTKKHVCFYCQVKIVKISRHLIVMHTNEPEVAKTIKMHKRSCERRKGFLNLIRMGDFSYNCKVLAERQGKLVLVRCPKENIGKIANYYDFSPCPVCLGFFMKERLLVHVKTCCGLKNKAKVETSVFLNSKALINKVNKPKVSQSFIEHVLSKLREDEIGEVAANDHLITDLGLLILEEIEDESDEESREGSYEQCRQSMILVAQLLIMLKAETNQNNSKLKEFVHPNHFDSVTKAVTSLCSFTTEMSTEAEKQKEVLATSSLKNHIQMVALILRGNALRSGNIKSEHDSRHFFNKCSFEWSTVKKSDIGKLDDFEVVSHATEFEENTDQEIGDEEDEYSFDEEETDKAAMDLSIGKHRVQHTCLYCHRKVFKLLAHLRAIHQSKRVVARILSMPIGSKVRRKELVRLGTKKTKLSTNININNVGSTSSQTDLVYYNTKKHVCFYCQVKIVKILRHLIVMHTNEPEVAKTIKMHKRSCERRKGFLNLIRMGDFSYNCKVLAERQGKLVLVRCPKENIGKITNYYDFTPCPVCLGFYLKKRLLAHVKKCCGLKNKAKIESYVLLNSKALMNKVIGLKVPQTFIENVLSKLKKDEIGDVAVNDHLIRDVGLLILEEIQGESDEECKEESYEQCRQSMLLVAQLLIELRAKTNKNHSKLKDFIKPCHFDYVAKAVTKVCSFSTETLMKGDNHKALLVTTRALRNHVKMSALILRGNALRSGNIQREYNTRHFLNICSLEWSKIKKSANGNLNESDIVSNNKKLEDPSSYFDSRECEDRFKLLVQGNLERNPERKDRVFPCFFCSSSFEIYYSYCRHLKNLHGNEPGVIEVFRHPKGSFARKNGLNRLMTVGRFIFNCKVLFSNQGKILSRFERDNGQSIQNFGPCPQCTNFVLKLNLKTHLLNCAKANEGFEPKEILDQSNALVGLMLEKLPEEKFNDYVLSKLQNSSIADVIRSEKLLNEFGHFIYDPSKEENCVKHVILIARLLIKLRSITNMGQAKFEEFIQPEHVTTVVKAVKEISLEYCKRAFPTKDSSVELKFQEFGKKTASEQDLLPVTRSFSDHCKGVPNKLEKCIAPDKEAINDYCAEDCFEKYQLAKNKCLLRRTKSSYLSKTKPVVEYSCLVEKLQNNVLICANIVRGNILRNKNMTKETSMKHFLTLFKRESNREQLKPRKNHSKTSLEMCIQNNNESTKSQSSSLTMCTSPSQESLIYSPLPEPEGLSLITPCSQTSNSQAALNIETNQECSSSLERSIILTELKILGTGENKQIEERTYLLLGSHLDERKAQIPEETDVSITKNKMDDQTQKLEKFIDLVENEKDDNQKTNFNERSKDWTTNVKTDTYSSSFSTPNPSKRMCSKRSWTEEESEAVFKFFRRNISKSQVPSKDLCEQAQVEEDCLQSRNWVSIKSKVHNIIRKQDTNKNRFGRSNKSFSCNSERGQPNDGSNVNVVDKCGSDKERILSKPNKRVGKTMVKACLEKREPLSCKPYLTTTGNTVIKKMWKLEESEAVKNYFDHCISTQTVPGREECEKCISQNACLMSRSWVSVKSKVYNMIVTNNRQLRRTTNKPN